MGDLILAFVAMVIVALGGWRYGVQQERKAKEEHDAALKERYREAVEKSRADGDADWRDRLRDTKSLRD